MLTITKEDFNINDSVLEKVCSFFDISKDKVISFDSSKTASLARSYVYYILHYSHNFSAHKICEIYGRKNIRGVFKVISKIKYLIENTKQHNNDYKKIRES